jgi:hypothetical protein
LVTIATRSPRGERLLGQQRGDVEKLVERLGPDHPCLMKESVDGHIRRCQQGSGVRRRGLRPRGRTAALDGENRFPARKPARHPRELARVAEGLQIQQREVRAGVLLPVREQIVARQIGLVADRDER